MNLEWNQTNRTTLGVFQNMEKILDYLRRYGYTYENASHQIKEDDHVLTCMVWKIQDPMDLVKNGLLDYCSIEKFQCLSLVIEQIRINRIEWSCIDI